MAFPMTPTMTNSKKEKKRPTTTAYAATSSDNLMTKKPILVVGATGRIGRRVVQELLSQGQPVRALVLNETKAKEVLPFEDDNDDNDPLLEMVVCDLNQAAKESQQESSTDDVYTLTTPNKNALLQAVQGCGGILSLSGCLRYSKWSDFLLPWRVLNYNVKNWADVSHPYWGNYRAQQMLIDALAAENAQTPTPGRFVRITGLSAGYPAFHPVSMIFGSIVSLSNRYHFLCEDYLRNQAHNNVPYVILRPGGMEDEDRDPTKANLQVDATGSLPAPARISRSDVVALAVAAVTTATTTTKNSKHSSSHHDNYSLPPKSSYILAVRGVGMLSGKPQGEKKDGYATARECFTVIQNQTDKIPTTTRKRRKIKPYGLAVLLFVYSLSALSIQLTRTVVKLLGSFTLWLLGSLRLLS